MEAKKKITSKQTSLDRWVKVKTECPLMVYCCNLERAVAAIENRAAMPSAAELRRMQEADLHMRKGRLLTTDE